AFARDGAAADGRAKDTGAAEKEAEALASALAKEIRTRYDKRRPRVTLIDPEDLSGGAECITSACNMILVLPGRPEKCLADPVPLLSAVHARAAGVPIFLVCTPGVGGEPPQPDAWNPPSRPLPTPGSTATAGGGAGDTALRGRRNRPGSGNGNSGNGKNAATGDPAAAATAAAVADEWWEAIAALVPKGVMEEFFHAEGVLLADAVDALRTALAG
ncbi:unnamed protein product, partial [Phaeothamnion confervicola]